MLNQVHADRSRAEQERRYSAATTELDKAIRYLNLAIKFDAKGNLGFGDKWRINAAYVLQRIGPELLIIDPDAIL